MRTTRFFGAVFASLLAVAALGSPATAQTSGLSCSQCPGGNLPAWNCPVQEEIQISSGCLGFNNCQTPETAPQGVEIIQTGTTPSGGGIFEARLSVEVKARWNSEADIGPNGKLDMWWRSGGTATHPTSDLCEHNTTDRVYTQLRFGALSCDGAPYSLGTYSMRAVVCGGSSCQRISDESGLTVQVTTEMLGCPDPPKESCNGDAACTTCLAGGASAGGAPPAFGGPGFPFTGPGATLRYTAGGVGHPGYPGTPDWNTTLGRYWSAEYFRRIVPDPDESHVWLLTEHGTFREWSSPDGSGVYQTVSPSSEYRTLTWLGAGFGWELRDLDGTVHLFDDDGLWQSSTDRNGNATTGTYSGSQLVSVDFPAGRREDFTYDGSTGKLATIDEVGVDGVTTRTWTYTWDGDDLERIDRPDETALLFHYDEPSFPGYLTRVEMEGTDGTSIRVERGYEYDGEGNAVRTWKGDASPTGPDAVEVWSLAFDDPGQPTQTTVTDPLGNASVYQLARDLVSSNVKVTSISGDCPTCGLGPNTQLFYEDSNHPMLPTRTIDGRGFTTVVSYTAFGEVESRTEAMGEPEERTTTWTYDATFPALVESIEQPSVTGGAALRTTDFTLDGSGNATGRTITGMEAGSAFSYTTTTTFNAAGMPETIDPPGHGTDDVTTYTYDPARGSLVADSRTDPLVGATTFDHDPFHRLTSETDPNGVETVTSYDALDRVTEVRMKGANPPTDDLVTTYEYTVFGDLLRTTLPEGNVVEYSYDTAGRLETVERKPDAATPGERIFYTLDAAGNRTSEKLQRWDAGSSAWVTASETTSEYSTRCQLDRVIQAPGTAAEAITEFEYDCNGNVSAQWDANHNAATDPPTTSYAYDALDRLATTSQPWAGGGNAVTSYGYDVQGHLTSVTDAEGNVTQYTYSDRDLLTQEFSPVSGTTTHTYDEHGELGTTTDARGITVVRTVDALDRVTFVDYPDDALDITYVYDTAPVACGGTSFPVGRLGTIARNGASIDNCYDRFGRQTMDGELVYAWDGNGNRTGIIYPGGVSAAYTHDFADREASLTVTTPGGAEGAVVAASYLPFGPLSTLMLGSGSTETRVFDGRYVPMAIGISGDPGGVGDRTWSYTTDRVGNILSIVETAGGACAGTLVLENQTVTTTETFTSCADLQAGNGFAVESPGDVLFEAVGKIVLTDGFSVGSGASFEAAILSSVPPLSTRTYGYQAPLYFLTLADGPWGTLDWTYDRIGNRLSETRNGGNSDSYVYTSNGTGNTPILDQVTLGVGNTRDYTWGAAGHLEEVDAAGNVIEFQNDAAGRLSGVGRAIASESAGFTYDGRSYLTTAAATAGSTSSVTPLYDSFGLVHALRRKDTPASSDELVNFFYLAGRPVAQVAIDSGTSTESWTYLTTNHLGTPMLATGDAGTVTWEGGFEPFGTDYQAGTAAGASENGIYLRLPGQWEDETWEQASSGAGVYYNVHRFLAPSIGRYNRPDPILLGRAIEHFSYARARPMALFDALGLQATTGPAPTGSPANDKCCGAAHAQGLFSKVGGSGIVVCCDGNKVACALEYSDPRLSKSGALAQKLWIDCTFKHEGVHVQDLPPCPPCKPGPSPVVDIAKFPTPSDRSANECKALQVEINCLEKAKTGCGGDAVCIRAIDAKKGAAKDDQRRYKCKP